MTARNRSIAVGGVRSLAAAATACAILVVALSAPPSVRAGGIAETSASEAAEPRLARKIAELRELVAAPAYKDEREPCTRQLEVADRALARHLVVPAFAAVRACWGWAGPRRFASDRASVAAAGPEAFEREWVLLGRELESRRAAVGAAPAGAPLAVRAMVESELVTVDNYYTSGRLYGHEAGLEYGLYYGGRALTALDLAEFAGQLAFGPPPGPVPAVPPIAEDLRRLDEAILEAYRAASTADARREFIPVNTTFKLASDLERDGKRAGALLEYLRSVQALGTARRRGLEPPAVAPLQAALAGAARELPPGDHTLARLFVERAALALESASGEVAVQDRLVALVVVDDVVPAYRRVMMGGSR
jgi:hypothetical protein